MNSSMDSPTDPNSQRRESPTQEGLDGRRIVVGVDGSSSSIDALRLAARIATALRSPLEAITVWNLPAGFEVPLMTGWSPEEDAREILRTAESAVFADAVPSWFSSSMRRGSVARALIQASEGAEMLVLGSRGHGGFVGLLLGSVSAVCAEHARCPVLINHRPALATH